MDGGIRKYDLTAAEIRAILDDTERQALGGLARAAARAGLGTLALTAAVVASTRVHAVGLVLLGAALVLGLAVYIRSAARSVSMKPSVGRRPRQPVAAPPTVLPDATKVPPPLTETTLPGVAGGGWSRLAKRHQT